MIKILQYLTLLLPLLCLGQEQALVFQGALVYPVTAAPMEDGVLVVQHAFSAQSRHALVA